MAKKNVFQPRTEEEREFKKVIESIDYSKNSYEVFTDWIQCCALAYAQVSHYTDEKEERYKNIMNKYSEEDRHKFAELMAILIRAYTNKDGSAKFGDMLGDIYMACLMLYRNIPQTEKNLEMCKKLVIQRKEADKKAFNDFINGGWKDGINS